MGERELLFGTDSAEGDSDLVSYFIPTGTFRAVENKQKIIVVGRKGSGKSAIFSCINSEDTRYIKLLPNKYSLDVFQSFLNKNNNANYCNFTVFTALWKYLILKEVSSQIKDNTGSKIYMNKNITQESVNILDKWVESNIDVGTIQEFVTDNDKKSKLLLKSEEIDMERIEDMLNEKSVHILIDDLDLIWDNNKWSLNYIQGLIECAYDLCNKFSKKIFVTLFIREDIFSIIETNFHRIDNIRNQIETISWTPRLLKQLVAKRIQTYFKLTPQSFKKDYWYYTMPDKVNNVDSFNYMVERTQLRPRELVQFCSKSYEISTRYKKKKIETRDIIEGESIYSDWKLKDLCSEYATQYEGLINLLRAFSGNGFEFKKEDIATIIEKKSAVGDVYMIVDGEKKPITVDNTLRFLYDCGFIRAKYFDKVTNKNKFRSSSTYKNLNLVTFQKFDIHPAYRRAILG